MTRPRSEPLAFPFPIEHPERIPARRYFDREFFELECERLWPRVWQMACRLEEIPAVGDYVEYEILDKSVIVVRTEPDTVKAFHNACRHRGMRLVEGRGNAAQGFVCPFHGWCWNADGSNRFVFAPNLFQKDQLEAGGSPAPRVSPRDLGRLRLHQLRRRRAAAAALHRALRDLSRRLAGREDAGRVLVLDGAPRQLEARERSLHGGLPRGADPSRSCSPARSSRATAAAPIRSGSPTPTTSWAARSTS